MRVPVLLVVAVLACASVSACRTQTPDVRPARLRLGVAVPPSFAIVPGEVNSAQFAPLAAYLESAVHVPVSLVVSRNVNRICADFEAGLYDVAFLGAAHFAHAHLRAGAIPLVMRNEDRQTTSVFIAAARDPRTSLVEFKGARFGFGPMVSSSHLMARRYLEHLGITPETFFRSVSYSAGPGDTALLVRDGAIDLGVGTTVSIARMFTEGTLRHDQVRILIETPPYVNLVWAASVTLPGSMRMELRDAFLALSVDSPEERPILRSLEATAFMPASIEDYEELAGLLKRLSLVDRPLDIEQEPR